MIISPEIDGWLKLVGLVGGAGLGTRILIVLVQTRDSVRDFMRDVGQPDPPTGLFRKIAELDETTEQHTIALTKLGFERRQTERRHPL